MIAQSSASCAVRGSREAGGNGAGSLTSGSLLRVRDEISRGADVVFSGATTDSTMTGTFVATANGETVGTGNWSVRRSR